jgi:hypothetical protein
MAYEVCDHDGGFIVVNRHTGEGDGLVTPVIEGVGPGDEDAPRKLDEVRAYEMARRFPTRQAAEEWLAKAF